LRAASTGNTKFSAIEAAIEDFLRLDADVDTDCDHNREKQQHAAQQRVREHSECGFVDEG